MEVSQCLILLYSMYRDENAQLADIFLKKGPYLKMYSTYIREFDKNVALLEEQSKKNPAFGAVIREFEVTRVAWPVFSVWGGVSYEVSLFIVCEFVPENCVIYNMWFVCFFVQGQSTLCELGSEALPTEACSEDSSVSAVAHRCIFKIVTYHDHIQSYFLTRYLSVKVKHYLNPKSLHHCSYGFLNFACLTNLWCLIIGTMLPSGV